MIFKANNVILDINAVKFISGFVVRRKSLYMHLETLNNVSKSFSHCGLVLTSKSSELTTQPYLEVSVDFSSGNIDGSGNLNIV